MKDSNITKRIEELVAQASFVLRKDILGLLNKAYKNETNKKAKKALGWILENARISQKERLAICQDTGLPVVFIEAARGIKISSSVIKAISKGVESGYKKNYLRASMVDPLARGKSSHKGIIYHLDFVSKQKGLRVTVLPKGFGSENKSQLKMFNPTASIDNIEEFIVDCVREAGPEGCPPFVVGVGIGGTSDKALHLAKKALIDRVDTLNPDNFLNNLEKRLLKKINVLKIGPMGLGGKSTCLAVKILKIPTHIAGLPVGVNVSCWALRSATIRL